MTKMVLLPDDFRNCPVCGQLCKESEVEGYNSVLRKHGVCQEFLCTNPLPNNPLHYYVHIVDKSKSNCIAYQEFSVNIETKYVLFGLDLIGQKSFIKHSAASDPLELNFVIVPDFPDLGSLVKKIRTAIVFS